ncbi:MAG: response regulator [Chloroflexi bacterium]|nr:response regulator [Chloroflexota bacterium]
MTVAREILLVEDNAVERLSTAALLRQAGYKVTEAADGAEAIEELTAREVLPNAVLSDIGLPKMNGIAVCRHIKTSPSLQHLPVVLFTALGTDHNHTAAIEAGADDFLVKPVKDGELIFRMSAALARVKLRAPGGSEWHRGVLDALPEAIAVTDAEHHYVDANPAALALLGYTRGELMHLSAAEGQAPPWASSAAAWHGLARVRSASGASVGLEVEAKPAQLGAQQFWLLILRRPHA